MHPNRPAYIAQCALFMLLIIACFACALAKGSATPHIVATSQAGAQVCFPASEWNSGHTYKGYVSPEDRPCTTVFRPEEDGSGDLILGSVGADAATCTIPNVYEERGKFVIQCHRVPNR